MQIIGRGGNGIVYLSEIQNSEGIWKDVAIKIMNFSNK